MQMTDGEILTSFKQAAKPADQVQILADLNGCDVSIIKSILVAQGVDPRKLPRAKRKLNPVYERKAAPAADPAPAPAPAAPPVEAAPVSVLEALKEETERQKVLLSEIDEKLDPLVKKRERINGKLEALAGAYALLAQVYEEETA